VAAAVLVLDEHDYQYDVGRLRIRVQHVDRASPIFYDVENLVQRLQIGRGDGTRPQQVGACSTPTILTPVPRTGLVAGQSHAACGRTAQNERCAGPGAAG
jgi:hypothetical protein